VGQSHREGAGYEDKYILPTFSVGCEFTTYYVAGPFLMAATLSTAVCPFVRFSVTRWRHHRELSCRRSSPHKRGTAFVYFSFWLRVL